MQFYTYFLRSPHTFSTNAVFISVSIYFIIVNNYKKATDETYYVLVEIYIYIINLKCCKIVNNRFGKFN